MSETEHEHHIRTPTSQLTHEERLRRQARHMQILTAVLLVVLALLVYSAAFDLDHWAEWIVFGGIVAVAVGAAIALRPSRSAPQG